MSRKQNCQIVSCHVTDAKFEEKLVCCFKNDKNLVNFDPTTQKPQKFAFLLVPFCTKCITFDWKKIQTSYLS